MLKKESLPGLNIQYPISRRILSGEKTVETRHYAIPDKYLNVPMWIIETPGRSEKFKARVIGRITFVDQFLYKSKADFQRDFERHKVEVGSPWFWVKGKVKWGWRIGSVEALEVPIEVIGKKGIVFTTAVKF